MTTYELRIHTRDVSITESGLGDIGRHTGYDLIEYEKLSTVGRCQYMIKIFT